jgi:hypothetical protein
MLLSRWDEKERAILAWLLMIKNRLKIFSYRTLEEEQELKIRQAELNEHKRVTNSIYNVSDPSGFLFEIFVKGGHTHKRNFLNLIVYYAQTDGAMKLK